MTHLYGAPLGTSEARVMITTLLFLITGIIATAALFILKISKGGCGRNLFPHVMPYLSLGTDDPGTES